MKVTTLIFQYQKIIFRGSRLQDVQRSKVRSTAMRGQTDDISDGER